MKNNSFKVGDFTLYKQKGCEIWYYYVRWNNKQIRRSTKTTSPIKAKQYIQEVVVPQLYSGNIKDKKVKITLKEALDKYLAFCNNRNTKSTYRSDKLPNSIKLINAFGENMDVRKITRADIKEHLNKMGLAADTIRSHYKSIRAFFNHILDDNMIDVNPAEKLDKFLPKPNKKICKYHEPEIMDSILAKVKTTDFELYRIFLLMKYTAIRIEEARSLKPDNFDWKNHILRIKRRDEIGFTIKSHKERDIPFSSQLNELFKPTINRKSEWIFTRLDGKRWETDPKKNIERFVKESGIKTTFHRWRHSFCANWLRSGRDIYQLSRILGHSSVSITEERYGNFTIGRIQDIVEDLYGN